MQLYGLDGQMLIPAVLAEPGKNYSCPECGEKIRLKSGGQKQPHFFHLYKPQKCQRAQRGPEHLQLQLNIQKLLPESFLEYRFPEIGRIADVAWPKGKTIFEIQFSPISEQEALNRCLDYESLGFQVVWILHDRHFNQKILSRSERLLRQKTCYYSNMDAEGKGYIYDQLEEISHRWRRFKSTPFPVDLSSPWLNTLSLKKAPFPIGQRAKKWLLYHRGDAIDLFLNNRLPNYLTPKKTKIPQKKRYRKLLYILLEIISK